MRGKNGETLHRFTLDRAAARELGDLDLLGLDHPLVQAPLRRWQAVPPERVGLAVKGPDGPGVVSWWLVETKGPSGEHRSLVMPLGVSCDGKRNTQLERIGTALFNRTPDLNSARTAAPRTSLLHETLEPMLDRELRHREIVPAGGSYTAKMIGWVEVAA